MFPDQSLKPKHHYVLHYPSLILKFGPLIRLWTLRFESKHSYFKECARKMHNFLHLSKTLAERHQLLQSYLGCGQLFPPLIQIAGEANGIDEHSYNKDIQMILKEADIDKGKTSEVSAVFYKGTKYTKGLVCIDEIQRVLPELDHERLLAITEHLSSVVGVTKKEDLAFLEKADFQEYLTPIQCRKLLQAFKQRALCQVETENGQSCFTPLQTQSYNPGSTLLKTQNSWISQFQIPWEKMPASLSQTMLRGQRASPADRRAMVRTVVSTMQQHCSNPNRAACTEIAKTIVAKYPLTFADMNEEGEQIGIGYYSLINQLKTRVEHVNRNNTSDRIRRPRTTQSSNADATIKTSRCKLDSYGCVNWQPRCLPDGETADSLEERRKQMAATFQSVGPRAADSPDIDFLMDLTYIYQCHMINTCPPPSVCEIEEKWPFFFTKRGLCNNFKILTGIDICDRLGEALQTKRKKIVHFFQSHSHNKDTHCHGIAVILLLMKCFGEKEESVFLLADTTSTKASVKRERALPPSPRLLMLVFNILILFHN
uniref:Uncharacterized protein n=1 Tax=Nothobranchius furzeri TaxID=105023 RepID=A0A8C6LRA2_NOTFU